MGRKYVESYRIETRESPPNTGLEKEFLVITVSDGWIYRFCRLSDSEPFQWDMTQRPNGERYQTHDASRSVTLPPDCVKEFDEGKDFSISSYGPEKNRNQVRHTSW